MSLSYVVSMMKHKEGRYKERKRILVKEGEEVGSKMDQKEE